MQNTKGKPSQGRPKDKEGKIAKADSTLRSSQAVPHPRGKLGSELGARKLELGIWNMKNWNWGAGGLKTGIGELGA